MIEQGITLEEVKLELADSHVIDKKIKQEKMVYYELFIKFTCTH